MKSTTGFGSLDCFTSLYDEKLSGDATVKLRHHCLAVEMLGEILLFLMRSELS